MTKIKERRTLIIQFGSVPLLFLPFGGRPERSNGKNDESDAFVTNLLMVLLIFNIIIFKMVL